MSTARDVVKRSLQKIGVLVKSEAPSADEASDGLNALNNMLGSWTNDGLLIVSRAWETFTLAGGTALYTMSVGLTFNTPRPVKILSAYIRIGTIDHPLSIIGDEEYNRISFKALRGIPQFLSYDNAFPTDNLRLYPVPAAAYPLFILSEKPITQLTTLDSDVNLPDGWEEAMIYNLAMRLAPEYGQQIDPVIADIARKALGAIRINTARNRPIDAYPAGGQVRNIFSGWRN